MAKKIRIEDLTFCVEDCEFAECDNVAGFLLLMNVKDCGEIEFNVCPDCLAKMGIKVIKALK